MITEKEISALELSPVKSDFYQIWNELIDVAGKLSERWDPSSTNESDPGIVLLKVLTAIADKLNYNIDKNILEAFMPSAAQAESMRKLCDMLGYSMKYYQSAETTVTVAYNKSLSSNNPVLEIPRFTSFYNEDKDINYVTTSSAVISESLKSVEIPCIEGSYVQCSTSDEDYLITINQLDDQYRYYFPESQIAENGIFVYTVDSDDNESTEAWTKVDLLSTQVAGSRVYKFGYDSKESLPYIQFMDDVSDTMGEGLHIYYIRTSGVNGNISANTLSSFDLPSAWDEYTDTDGNTISSSGFAVTNKNAATNGVNPESINDAYENYKKTIGTFDALITCRDYMNKIYSLVDDINVPLCSNIKVSDIRNDINRSHVLCSFNDYGINYIEEAVKDETTGNSKIDNFTLMLYPFKTVYGTGTKSEYDSSFDYTPEKRNEILSSINEIKTISHKFQLPDSDELVCIKNYLKLDARITTSTKVNTAEESAILANVRKAIYQKFNMRKLDFGQEIPFDSILETIESADTRIKNVSLDEPALYTVFQTADGNEYSLASYTAGKDTTTKELYNKLAVRNILAGRIALFNYDTSFKADFDETAYGDDIKPLYPVDTTYGIKKIQGFCNLPTSSSVTLTQGEVVKFRFPNITTTTTFSAYTNYYLKLNSTTITEAQPAVMKLLYEFLTDSFNESFWTALTNVTGVWKTATASASATITALESQYIRVYDSTHTARLSTISEGTTYSYINLSEKSEVIVFSKALTAYNSNYSGLYRKSNSDSSYVPGYLVDSEHNKYLLISSWATTSARWFEDYYVQDLSSGTTNDYGRGIDAVNSAGLTANAYYQLKTGEFLFINYTQSNTVTNDDDTTTTTDTVVNTLYGPGTIIKPNFSLENSKTSTKSPSKTSGYEIPSKYEIDWNGSSSVPTKNDLKNYNEKQGLLSLGANEQIELCTPSQVEFGSTYFFYPVANTDEHLDIFDNSQGTGKVSYILEDGEYLYYTDVNMLSYAYFGPGTEIHIPAGVNIKPTDSAVTASEIVTSGISVIPWVKYTYTSGDKLTGVEYQYLTLTSGDILNSCSATDLDSTWKSINSASYTLSGTADSLPQQEIAVTKDDFNTGTFTSWEAMSYLAISAGPSTAQTLYNTYDTVTLYVQNFKTGTTEFDTDAEITTISLSPSLENKKALTFKTNYSCTAGMTGADTAITEYSTSSGDYVEVNDFKVKTYQKTDFGFDGKATYSSLNNLNNSWTSITMSDLQKNTNFSFNVNLNTDQYGLLLVYINSDKGIYTSGNDYTSYVRIESDNTLAIFNQGDDYKHQLGSDGNYGFKWWSGMSNDKYYCLKNGLNILWLSKSGKYYIYPAASSITTSGTIIFGEIDLITVNKENCYGINLKQIDYDLLSRAGSTVNPYIDQINDLLYKLHQEDTDNKFYYNNLLDNSTVIDFNNYESTEQSLSDPMVWYDTNNLNNDFVISEIDSDYMINGIRIARSSKLK